MKKIGIAIVGLNFGRHIINQIVDGAASEYIELKAVCDIDADKAKEFSRKYSVPYYKDLDDLLNEESIPAIGLFTGPGGRAQLLDKIIDAGKDVITTKPFELDCEAALAVLRKANKMGRVIHINSPGPYLSDDLAMVSLWAEKHDLGQAVACQMHVWVRYNEKPDGKWLDDPKLCPVAPVFRLGIYLINDLVSMFGEAEKVTVVSSRLFTGRPTPDQGQLTILFKTGLIATIFASFCIEDGDHYQNGMTLNYERGTIYRNVGPHRKLVDRDGKGELSLVMGNPHDPKSRKVVESALVNGVSGQYQWQNFVRAVNGDRDGEVTTPEKVVAGLRIIEAMAKASEGSGVADVKG